MFSDLSEHRAVSENIVRPIPYTELVAYIDLHGIFDVEEFIRYIREMDKVYVQMVSKKISDEIERLKRKAKKR